MSNLAIARLRAKRARTMAEIRFSRSIPKPGSGPPRPRVPAGEGVYVLREKGSNLIKIGCTGDFRKRYASLRRSDNPRELLFLGWLSRNMGDEGMFHTEFRNMAAGLGGGTEWFAMTDQQILELETRLL